MDRTFKLLQLLNSDPKMSQRRLSEQSGLSLGSVNMSLRALEKDGYVQTEKISGSGRVAYHLTQKGLTQLENNLQAQSEVKLDLSTAKSKCKVRTAVILAAGEAREIDHPPGLLPVNGETLIDRSIRLMHDQGIERVILVVGWQGEEYRAHFAGRDVTIVENPRYHWTGTMASLACAADEIRRGGEDFLLVESDLVFESKAIRAPLESLHPNCVLLANPSGSGDEAFVELDSQGYIYRIAKDIHQMNRIDGEVIGITKVSLALYEKMMESFANNQNEYLNYEYMLENIGRIYKIHSILVDDLRWGEVDDQDQYDMVRQITLPKIVQKEQAMSIQNVKNLLVEILGIEEREIEEVSQAGGMTNTNYRVRIKGDEYILRIPGTCTEEMINRENERVNGKIGSLLGINANVIYFNAETGVKLSELIPQAETLTQSTARQAANMKLTAQLLHKLHTSGVTLNNDFDGFEEVLHYEQMMHEANVPFFADYETEVRPKFFTLPGLLDRLGRVSLPCHNDLVPENLVKSGSGRMYLVDWEYSGMNDPMWDLAAHMLECSFDEQETELFLESYFGHPADESSRIKIAVFMICQDILWALWTLLKEAKGDDYGDYGTMRYERGKKLLSQLLESL